MRGGKTAARTRRTITKQKFMRRMVAALAAAPPPIFL